MMQILIFIDKNIWKKNKEKKFKIKNIIKYFNNFMKSKYYEI